MTDLSEISEAKQFFFDQISDRQTWTAIGFSLASIGEAGRQVFIDISLNQSNYAGKDTEDSLNREFNRLLNKHTGATNLNTFFYYAKQYGYKRSGFSVFKPFKPPKQIRLDGKTVTPENAAKINLKRLFLAGLINLLPEPSETDHYLYFDRSLEPATIKRNKIRSLDQSLDIWSENPEFKPLPTTEDGKAILDLRVNKLLYRPLFIDLMQKLKPEMTQSEIKDFLEQIGIFRKVGNCRLFAQYQYNYIIPTFDQTGNINNIQFTGNRETRARLGKEYKYFFPKSLPGENFPLFYYPLDFPTFKDNLIITEGLIDCFSALEYGFNSIALFTANFSLDYQKKKELDTLKHFNIYLLIENDTAGTKAQNILKDYMTANGFKLKITSIKALAKIKGISEPVKDFNDLNKLRKAK